MPTLHVVRNMRVVMFFNDHEPAHFHAHGPGWRLRVHLGTWETRVVSGRPRDFADVTAWAREHGDEPLARWRAMRGGQ
jgi:hypothetical protein